MSLSKHRKNRQGYPPQTPPQVLHRGENSHRPGWTSGREFNSRALPQGRHQSEPVLMNDTMQPSEPHVFSSVLADLGL